MWLFVLSVYFTAIMKGFLNGKYTVGAQMLICDYLACMCATSRCICAYHCSESLCRLGMYCSCQFASLLYETVSWLAVY